jgi:predicted nucleic acid-binding Zn ribbon protein
MERAQKKIPKDQNNTACSEENNEFLNEEYLKARQRCKLQVGLRFHLGVVR